MTKRPGPDFSRVVKVIYLYFPSPPKIITWGAALSLVAYLYSLRRVARSRPHVTVVSSTLGHELSGVPIVRIPRFLASVQRTCVGVALGFQIKDGVERIRPVLGSGHNSVLVGSDYVGNVADNHVYLLLVVES